MGLLASSTPVLISSAAVIAGIAGIAGIGWSTSLIIKGLNSTDRNTELRYNYNTNDLIIIRTLVKMKSSNCVTKQRMRLQINLKPR